MGIRLRLILLYLVIGIALLAGAGCSSGKEPQEAEADDAQGKYSLEYIQESLKSDKNAADISWSKNKSRVAFFKNTEDYEVQMYLWNVGEARENKVAGASGNLYDLKWSPDSRFVTVNEGTSTVYETLIIDPDNLTIADKIVNAGGPVWSPDSARLAFAVLNNKKPIVAVEWDGTCDLVIYDLKTKNADVILAAENDFYYSPKSWDKGGLRYEKCYFDDRKPEVLIHQEGSQGKTGSNSSPSFTNAYNISTQTYTDQQVNIEVEIKYPVITKMQNKDIENRINSIIENKFGLHDEPTETGDETFKETLNVNYEVKRRTENALSLRIFFSAYMEGAAHPSNFIEGLTINLKTGKELQLQDLFAQGVDYKSILDPILKEKVNKLDYELFEEFKGIEDKQGFYLTDTALVIYYQEYVYTPHAVGPLEFEIDLNEIDCLIE
ncbi:DUF3298 domain-containing protein [Phosphitispora fastidiosa]|uniref:DUF3298 domain-containing protein n=1 Tax=Phosphitispora fastidiosa TaxID=2837202 RepID=UPI001E5ACC0A|nr:DUF3298 domain-containing protein [Phosphitispora fastidiosa]MBU7006014.1 hypothetical protein [Phosphitispora fastidiosa]